MLIAIGIIATVLGLGYYLLHRFGTEKHQKELRREYGKGD